MKQKFLLLQQVYDFLDKYVSRTIFWRQTILQIIFRQKKKAFHKKKVSRVNTRWSKILKKWYYINFVVGTASLQKFTERHDPQWIVSMPFFVATSILD